MPRKKKRLPPLTSGIIKQIKRYTQAGYSTKEIASAIAVPKRILDAWLIKYPFLLQKFTSWRADATEKVENALFKRACGFTKMQQKVFIYRGDPVVVDYIHYYPPNVQSIELWLTNRNPEEWKKRVDNTISMGDESKTLNFTFQVKEAPTKKEDPSDNE